MERSTVDIYEDMIRTRDGIRLRYRTWIPDNPISVVVLVHGAGEHLEIYEHLGNRCSRDGIAFVAFDLRGFGRSEGKCGHVTCFHEYLKDVDQLVRLFKQKLGNLRFYLIGHSLGGLIVTRYVQSRLGDVDGVVLSAPALGLRFRIPHTANRVIRFFSRRVPMFSVNPYRWLKRVYRIPRIKSMVSDYLERKLNDPAPPAYSVRWVQELLANIHEAMKHAERVAVPTLCICGRKDPLIHPDTIRSFFDRLTAKEKKWILLPGEGHCLLHSERPTQVIDTLVEWIKG
ncbi:alpha/beta fold hydrolase [Paludifilum halophilum]|uniref:Serine aminopeptidase S33 domain-containing protein n=1 Tax=Paludifilum halophilum TaxID=1642702 RepID=A0A235B9Y8_9BACL|nr:alpha/beta fold hydrolase [Paludifilum halophilum]OYD09118.1 hypothetical protein CHM34_04965 [Paludifilum halophilum]